MEHNADNTSSDKDAQMQSSFESYAGDTDKKEKKEKPKKKKKSLFDMLAEESKQEKREDESNEARDQEVGADDREPFSLTSLFASAETEESADEPENLSEELGELTKEEVAETAEQLLDARDELLTAELETASEGSSEEIEVLTNSLLIEQIKENIDDGQEPEEAIESAAATIAEVLDAETDVQGENMEPSEEAVEEELSPGEVESIDADEEFEEEATEAASVINPVTASAAAPPPPSSGTFGGGGHVSPVVSSSHAPVSPGSHAASREAVDRFDSRRQRGADLLVGGIIGYMIGRRRGRIKTEARMKPIQEALEKQVRDLDQKVSIKEKEVRSLAAEKYAQEGEAARQAIAERVEAKARAKQEAKDARKAESQKPTERLSQMISRPEKLAQVIVPKVETVPLPQTKDAEINFRLVPTVELLQAAAQVEIAGQNIRRLFEQGQLNQEDLRDLLTEKQQDGQRLERLFYERLKPRESFESPEALNQTEFSTSASRQGAVQDLGVASVAPFATVVAQPTPNNSSDVEQAANNLLATQALREKHDHKQLMVWMVILGLGISIVFGFFLF